MKILVYGINYAPELTGIGKYTGEMAEWLARQGHDVRVVTAPPYYPEWQVSSNYTAWIYHKECQNNIVVWRCPIWVPRNPSGLKRIIHLLSFAFSSFPTMLLQLLWRPNVILVVEPPLFCSPTTILISWLCRAKSWLHIQDFEVDAAFSMGLLSSTKLRKILIMFESLLMKRFDIVSTISSAMITQLSIKGVSISKQILFPNWVDTAHIYPIHNAQYFRNLLNISTSDIVFLYSGNMGKKQGLEIVIEAAEQLKNKNIVFVMCGHGAAYSQLRVQAKKLNNIHWLPLQPLSKLNELLNMADVHLLPQKADAADIVMPSKLTGMLASGRVVLATAKIGTELATVLNNLGVTVPPEGKESFVNAIIELAKNSEQRQILGNKSREYAVKYLGAEAVFAKFEQDLRSIS